MVRPRGLRSASRPNVDQQYWLIELHCQDSGPVMYYTSPGHWHNCADLATKFHDGLAAKIEADTLRYNESPHEIKVNQHSWGP